MCKHTKSIKHKSDEKLVLSHKFTDAASANGAELAASVFPVSHQGQTKNILDQSVFRPLSDSVLFSPFPLFLSL